MMFYYFIKIACLIATIKAQCDQYSLVAKTIAETTVEYDPLVSSELAFTGWNDFLYVNGSCQQPNQCQVFQNDCLTPLTNSYLVIGASDPWSVTITRDVIEGWELQLCYKCISIDNPTGIGIAFNVTQNKNPNCENHIQLVNPLPLNQYVIDYISSPKEKEVFPSYESIFTNTDPSGCGQISSCIIMYRYCHTEIAWTESQEKFFIEPYPFKMSQQQDKIEGYITYLCIKCASLVKPEGKTFEIKIQQYPPCSSGVGIQLSAYNQYGNPQFNNSVYKQDGLNEQQVWDSSEFFIENPACPFTSCSIHDVNPGDPNCTTINPSFTGTHLSISYSAQQLRWIIKADVTNVLGYNEFACFQCQSTTGSRAYQFHMQQYNQNCAISLVSPLPSSPQHAIYSLENDSIRNSNLKPSDFFQSGPQLCPTPCFMGFYQTDCSTKLQSPYKKYVQGIGWCQNQKIIQLTNITEGYNFDICIKSWSKSNLYISNVTYILTFSQSQDCVQALIPFNDPSLSNPLIMSYTGQSSAIIIQGWQNLIENRFESQCGQITNCKLYDETGTTELTQLSSNNRLILGSTQPWPIYGDRSISIGYEQSYMYKCWTDKSVNQIVRKLILQNDCSIHIEVNANGMNQNHQSSYNEQGGTINRGNYDFYFTENTTYCLPINKCQLFQQDCQKELQYPYTNYVYVQGTELFQKTNIVDGYQIFTACYKCTADDDLEGENVQIQFSQIRDCTTNIKNADEQLPLYQVLPFTYNLTTISQGYDDKIFKIADEQNCGKPIDCQIMQQDCESNITLVEVNNDGDKWPIILNTSNPVGYLQQFCYKCKSLLQPTWKTFNFTIEQYDCSQNFQLIKLQTQSFEFDYQSNQTYFTLFKSWNELIVNQKPDMCPDPFQYKIKYGNDCDQDFTGYYIKINHEKSYKIEAMVNEKSGWNLTFCFEAKSGAQTIKSDPIYVQQKFHCLSHIVHANDQMNKKVTIPFLPSGEMTIANGWDDQIFINNEKQYCGQVTKCTLTQYNCNSQLSSDDKQLVQIENNSPWGLKANASKSGGWSLKVCYTCFSEKMINGIKLKLDINQIDCSDSLQIQKSAPKELVKVEYKNTQEKEVVIESYENIFENTKSPQCPQISNCQLLDNECKLKLNQTYISLNNSLPWSISSITNQQNGWSQSFCYQCQSQAIQVHLILNFQQLSDPSQLDHLQTFNNQQIDNLVDNNKNQSNQEQNENLQNGETNKLDSQKQYKKAVERLKNLGKYFKLRNPVKDQENKEISLRIVQILPDGDVSILFSERLLDLNDFKKVGLDLKQINMIKEEIFKVKYVSRFSDSFGRDMKRYLQEENIAIQKIPRLESWNISEFHAMGMTIKLNISNSLYVSSGDRPDKLQIQIKKQELFQSKSSFSSVKNDFKMSQYFLPQMGDGEEIKEIVKRTKQMKQVLIATVAFPFGLTIVLNFGMQKVWGLFLMLQVAGNLNTFDLSDQIIKCLNNEKKLNIPQELSDCPQSLLRIPGNCKIIVEMVYKVSTFKLFQDPFMQQWLKENVFGKFQWIQNFLIGDMFVTIILVVALLVLILYAIKKSKKAPFLEEQMRKKLFYSSIFRSQIQFFFPSCVLAIIVIFKCDQNDQNEIECNNQSLSKNVMKLGLMMFIPIFSFMHLKKNYLNLEDPEFLQKFGTLYDNLYIKKKTVYYQMSIFCMNRLIIASISALWATPLSIPILAQTKISLFTVSYIANNMPYKTNLLNYVEICNESFLIVTAYFLIMFSQWVYDPTLQTQYGFQDSPITRYHYGYAYIVSIVFVLIFNFVLILLELGSNIRHRYRKYRYEKLWTSYHKQLIQRNLQRALVRKKLRNYINSPPKTNIVIDQKLISQEKSLLKVIPRLMKNEMPIQNQGKQLIDALDKQEKNVRDTEKEKLKDAKNSCEQFQIQLEANQLIENIAQRRNEYQKQYNIIQ